MSANDSPIADAVIAAQQYFDMEDPGENAGMFASCQSTLFSSSSTVPDERARLELASDVHKLENDQSEMEVCNVTSGPLTRCGPESLRR